MKCPEHEGEGLRREGYRAAFCLRYLKHWDMCCEVRYMGICELLLGHEGEHIDKRGNK